jgi:hypothetical protein
MVMELIVPVRDGHHGSIIVTVVASSLGCSRATGKVAAVVDGATRSWSSRFIAVRADEVRAMVKQGRWSAIVDALTSTVRTLSAPWT